MSRSFKHRPFAGYCGGSQKQDKRIGNRIMRRTSRILTRVCDPDVVIYPVYDEVMNPWSMSQDGTRHYLPRLTYSRFLSQEEWDVIRREHLRK